MAPKVYTFPKSAKLCKRKDIELLFEKGNSFVLFPFRISAISITDSQAKSPKILVLASKKRFKSAVVRNKIKRQVRELYRLNQALVTMSPGQQLLIAIQYIGVYPMNWQWAIPKFQKALQKLTNYKVE